MSQVTIVDLLYELFNRLVLDHNILALIIYGIRVVIFEFCRLLVLAVSITARYENSE